MSLRVKANCVSTTFPRLTQAEFDELLRSCDVNLVRGEDSLVRALWAGKPFLWHIYPQDDGAHRDKLNAFPRLPASPRRLTHALCRLEWPPLAKGCRKHANRLGSAARRRISHGSARDWRLQLAAQEDLVTALVNFVEKKR